MGRIVIGAVVVMAACATPQAQYQGVPQQMEPFRTASGPSPVSAYSSSRDEYSDVEYVSKGKGLSVPHRERSDDGVMLVVRPDLLTGEFAVREVRPTSDAALDAAKASAADVT